MSFVDMLLSKAKEQMDKSLEDLAVNGESWKFADIHLNRPLRAFPLTTTRHRRAILRVTATNRAYKSRQSALRRGPAHQPDIFIDTKGNPL